MWTRRSKGQEDWRKCSWVVSRKEVWVWVWVQGSFLYTVGMYFHVECCIRQLLCTSIITCNTTSKSHNNQTNIATLLKQVDTVQRSPFSAAIGVQMVKKLQQVLVIDVFMYGILILVRPYISYPDMQVVLMRPDLVLTPMKVSLRAHLQIDPFFSGSLLKQLYIAYIAYSARCLQRNRRHFHTFKQIIDIQTYCIKQQNISIHLRTLSLFTYI